MTDRSSAIGWLAPLAGLLAALAAAAGLFVPGGPGPSSFASVHGQTVELYGRGLYQNDSLFFAATFKGIDIVTLAVFVPALAAAYWSFRRGSLRGAYALTAVLGVFLYNGASMAFAAAYNPLFLLYVAWLAASFFAFLLAFVSIDHQAAAAGVSGQMPRRGLATFLFLAGLAPLVLWLADVVGPLTAGSVPAHLGSYTTAFTYAVDLAIIVPAVYLAGYLLLRRAPLGYALAAVVLVLLAAVGVGVIAATAMQYSVGIVFSTGQLIGLIGSWVVLGGIAIVFTVILLRSLPDRLAVGQRPSKAQRPAVRQSESARTSP